MIGIGLSSLCEFFLGYITQRRQTSQPNHATFNKGFHPLHGSYLAVCDFFSDLVLVVEAESFL